MLIANTVFSGIQSAVGLTNAAVNLGNVIGNLHEQEANLELVTTKELVRQGDNQAIQNGYDPYDEETHEYRGYDDYEMTLEDGTKIKIRDLKNRAIETIGTKYWTERGRERGIKIARNAFMEAETSVLIQTMSARMQDAQNLYAVNKAKAIDNYARTGDRTQLDAVLDSAPGMPVKQREEDRIKTNEQAEYARVQYMARQTADQGGFSAGKQVVDNAQAAGLITGDDGAKILSDAARRQDVSMNAAKDEAQKIITANKDASPLAAYDALMGYAATRGDPEVRKEVENMAAQNQRNMLDKNFNGVMATIRSGNPSLAELEGIKRKFADGGAYSADYKDQPGLRAMHLDGINGLIRAKQAEDEARRAAASGPSDASLKTAAVTSMEGYARQFDNGEMPGPEAVMAIERLAEHDPATAQKIQNTILSGGENLAAIAQFNRLKDIIARGEPGKNAAAGETDWYDNTKTTAVQSLAQEAFSGASPAELEKLVDGFNAMFVSKILKKSFSTGDIGRSGWGGTADDVATAFAFHSARGNADLIYGQYTPNAARPYDTLPLAVGGKNAETVLEEVSKKNRTWANKQLEEAGIQLTNIEYERDKHGDRTGQVLFRATDGNTYRVNSKSENRPFGSEPRYLEVLKDGGWVKVNIKDLPGYGENRRRETQRNLRNLDRPGLR
ncbi:MAG: hypothetical protein LBP76_10280 [Treponema sp.]|jgi:hypothetical protein|nr:hypothetical protein [Treponema sp.]